MARTRIRYTAKTFPGTSKLWTGAGYNVGFPDGTPWLTKNVDPIPTYPAGSDHCVDTIMSPPYNVDHSLLITHKRSYPTRLWGRENAHDTINTHREHYGSLWFFSSYDECPTVSLPSDAVMKTRALASMNPNKPVVSIYTFLAEFNDLPNLIHNLGRHLIRKERRKSRRSRPSDLSDAWLSWSFGWAPLINDALALFDLPRQIEERKNYLRNLESGGYISRTIYGQKEVIAMSDAVRYNGWRSGSPAIRARLQRVNSVKSWYTANAKLMVSLPESPVAQGFLAQRLAYPLSINPADLWELLPWSWLADYFVNIGSVLEAQRDGIPWKCTRLNVMTRATSRFEINEVYETRDTSLTCNLNGYAETEVLRRTPYTNPTPSLGFLPLLTEGHIANITALSTSKFLRSFKQ